MNAQIETTEHLTKDEVTAVQSIASTIASRTQTLEHALEWLACFKSWFIYRGGNHIALHKASGDNRRILLVTA